MFVSEAFPLMRTIKAEFSAERDFNVERAVGTAAVPSPRRKSLRLPFISPRSETRKEFRSPSFTPDSRSRAGSHYQAVDEHKFGIAKVVFNQAIEQ